MRLAAAVIRSCCFLLVPPILSAATALAAQPQVSLALPTGGQRGKTVEVTISGTRLADAQELLFYEPGISVAKLEPVDAAKFKAHLNVAPDCRIGQHAFRVRAATGISNLWMFSVGALETVAEVEPNNEVGKPQEVALERTVAGVALREDVDYYAVNAKQGQRITAEIEGLRLGVTFFDPAIAILKADGTELARSDDAALLRQDAFCSIIAPADGRYLVRVQESSFGGDERSHYRLHLGTFPRPTAAFPAGGQPGKTVDVTWLGDPTGPKKQQVAIPSTAKRSLPIVASDGPLQAPSANQLAVDAHPSVLEKEPNNKREEGTAFNAPAVLYGIVGAAGDVDHFRFTGKKGQRFELRAMARKTLRSPLDAVLRLRDLKGKVIASNDDTGSPDSFFEATLPADGDYVVEIHDHLRRGGADFVYRVEVYPPTPSIVLRLPERVQYQPITLDVPRGNRMAALVTVERRHFSGGMKFEFGGLPKGVTPTANDLPAGSQVPMLFTAAADAPPASALVDIVARSTDPKVPVEGRLLQRTMLVRGQNNRDMWGHDARRMATVVTAEAPFHIDIVAPKVPLVRDGSMDLKIVARRAKDYKEPIALRMLYNPPGVASSGSITIPGDKNEATIPLTANGSAAIGTHKIVVLGQAKAGDGQREVSTQLVDLAVADRFFDFAYERAAATQGQPANLVVNITPKAPFDGAAKVEVVGLPKGVTSEPREITKDTKQLLVPIKVAADAPVGEHKTLVCRATVTKNGEPIVHRMFGAQLRINRPVVPKKTAAKPKPKPAAVVKQPKALSRLEQLRQAKSPAEKK